MSASTWIGGGLSETHEKAANSLNLAAFSSIMKGVVIPMNRSIEEKEVLTAKDVSLFLNVSMPTVYNVMKSKAFPSFNIAGRILVRKAKFFEWLENQERKESEAPKHNIENLCSI